MGIFGLPQWTYKELNGHEYKDIEKHLKFLGRRGWELVAVVPHNNVDIIEKTSDDYTSKNLKFYLKKPLEDDDN